MAGRHFTWPTPNRSDAEFAKTLHRLAAAHPAAQTIHLVLDNLSTHTAKSLRAFYGAEPGHSINRQRLRINRTFTRLDADNIFYRQLKLFKRSER